MARALHPEVTPLPVHTDGWTSAAAVLAILAHPSDIAERDRFIAALRAARVRIPRRRLHRNPPVELRETRDQFSSRDMKRVLDRSFGNISRRLEAHNILMLSQHTRRVIVDERGRDPRHAQRLRFLLKNSRLGKLWDYNGSGDYSVEREYRDELPQTIQTVLVEYASHRGCHVNNVRRDIWRPSLRVLPIARWLEIRMAPPGEVNGKPLWSQLPHGQTSRGLRYPLFYPMLANTAWLDDCIEFTNRMIDKWPEREGRYPALSDIDAGNFIRIVANDEMYRS